MKFVKGIAMLLCLVTIFTSVWVGNLGIGAEDGASGDFKVYENGKEVSSVVLPQDEKITLTVDENAGKQLKWQICADKSSALWVNISGQTKNFLTLSYAMVGSLLDRSGTTYVRCVADGKISTEVKVTLSYSVKEPAASAKEPVRKAPALKGVNPGEEKSVYTITVNYEFYDSYEFEDGEPAFKSYVATLPEGTHFSTTVNFPEKIGYESYYCGENGEETLCTSHTFDLTVDRDITVTVKYKPKTVVFIVQHYTQNINNDEYTLYDTTYPSGKVGAEVGDGLEIDIDGFKFLSYDKDITISATGETIVKVYYERCYYLVSFDLDGGFGTDPVYTRYGDTISVNVPRRPGYVWDGWELFEPAGGSYDLNSGSITLMNENLKFKAKWKISDTTYTVVYWIENADDDEYSYLESQVIDAKSAIEVNAFDYQDKATKLDKDHFTFNDTKTENKKYTVEGDGSTVVNVYYKRNTYTLTFKVLDCNTWWHFGDNLHDDSCYKTVATIVAKYDSKIFDEFNKAPFNTTYNGRAWECTDTDKYAYALQTLDRMPGFDATFTLYNKSSNTKKTIYYYVQKVGTSVSSSSWPTNQSSFDLMKQVDTYFNYATYTEEYHEIKGFTRYVAGVAGFSSNRKDFSNNRLYLYYLRNSYSLRFYNHNAFVTGKDASVQYETELGDFDFTPEYPDGLEPGAYEFSGWYLNPEGTGEEYVLSKHTMPAEDLTLYAKWTPKTHTVRIFVTYNDSVNGAEPYDIQYVPHNGIATTPAELTHGNYKFVGWFYMDGDEEKAFSFNLMPVTKDLDIYAKWSPMTPVKYTIRYKLRDETVIADDLVGSILASSTKTFIAKVGTKLYADYQTGYYPEVSSYNMEMSLEQENVYTFYYVKKSEVQYTVRYLYKSTGEQVFPDKTVTTSKAIETETFLFKSGYIPDSYQKTIYLSANDDENVITFWYEKDDENAFYVIRHFVQDVDGNGYTEFSNEQGPRKIGSNVTANPLTLTGFIYTGYNTGDDETIFTSKREQGTPSITLTKDGLVLNLYYDRDKFDYTVRYRDYNNQEIKVADDKIVTGNRYGINVSENAITVKGYELVGASKKTLTISNKDEQNVIIFLYRELTVNISYEAVPGEGGYVSPTSDNGVKASTGTPNGSTPTAKSGYRFVGWFTDEACTSPVPAEWVGADNKLVPQKNAEGLYDEATYYAKFERSLADLTIEKSGWKEIDENQSFIFRIKGSDENTKDYDFKVVIKGNGKITIADLPVGKYTVTEETSWSWRYTPDKASKDVDLKPEGSSVEFKNTRSDKKWLSGDAYEPNNYN